MASAIHHGAPGSYKSFAVVQRFAIPALIEEGRTVITNIRGFDSIQKIKDAFDCPLHPDSKLFFIDTSTREAREIFACWYKWIPFKALVIIDEAQTIYPDRADFKLEYLDKVIIPADFIQIQELPEPRPPDVFTAFDKQRHYNWDIFLTTTNISKIKRDIRESSEWAYRHRSLSEISRLLKGQWYEHQHDPEATGKSDACRVGSPKRYKADKRVFECYQSTATGDHVPSQAGTKLFSDGGIMLKLGVAAIAFVVGFFFLYYKFIVLPNQQQSQDEQTRQTKEMSFISTATASTDNQASALPAKASAQVFAKNDNPNPNPMAVIKINPSPNALSKRWRVSGHVKNKQGKLIVIASDLAGHMRLFTSGCLFDQFDQAICQMDGETVTKFSGSYNSELENKKPVLQASGLLAK